MRKIAAIMAGLVLATSLTGCAARTIDQNGQSHPNGVVYYDDQGNLHQADKEAFSPETQDHAETFATVVGTAFAIAGTALGIVALTN
ncbi:hypothetical protein [Herbiconiux daphne]|uniref:Lipoprotein n=1 Tax=Herbiconiux daphne TaxID=2970914 RepID=A0ABT2H9G6_9MICO|nr:hypothetical protein [Herbiconiux daphne]MCS5736593.1 hypothetical protein [Herbiconiux daphne]